MRRFCDHRFDKMVFWALGLFPIVALGLMSSVLGTARATVVYDVYSVKNGDTLARVSAKYLVSTDAIARKNGLKNDAILSPGMTLIIPKTSASLDPSSVSSRDKDLVRGEIQGHVVVTRVYTVKQGETLQSIARKYDVPVASIRERSRLTKDAEVVTGQIISIPLGEEYLSQDPPLPLSKKVDSGEPLKAEGATGRTTSPPAGKTDSGTAKKIPALQSKNEKPRVVGQLGTIILSGARIRKNPYPNATTVFKCDPGTQMVLVGDSGEWYGVLMIDGSTCYVPKKYVKVENVELVDEGSSRNGGNTAIIDTALRYLGIPYQYGGATLAGMDCSAFLQKVFYSHGTTLPRTAQDQFRVGNPVGLDQLAPGDRLYFSKSGSRVDHCGIYMGNGQFIHASGRAGYVTINNLFDSSHWSIFVGARR